MLRDRICSAVVFCRVYGAFDLGSMERIIESFQPECVILKGVALKDPGNVLNSYQQSAISLSSRTS